MMPSVLAVTLCAWTGLLSLMGQGQGPVISMPLAEEIIAVQAVPYVKMPEKVEVAIGRFARIKIETNGKTIRWMVPPELDSFREYDPDPAVIRLVVVGYSDGQYRIWAYTALGDVPSDPAICTVIVGKGPGPIPPVPPDPVPPKPDPPIPISGLRVLVVYESSQAGDVAKIIAAKDVVSYLDAKCAKGKDGKSPEWRFLDKDTNLASADKWVKDAMARPRQSIPWLIVSNGVSGFEGPVPATAEATLALLKKFGG